MKEQSRFTQGYDIANQAAYNQHFVCDSDVDVLTGNAPDNPATSELAYSLIRSTQAQLKVAVLHDLSAQQDKCLVGVVWQQDSVCFNIESPTEVCRYRYDLVVGSLSAID